jgi:hypothetical protein
VCREASPFFLTADTGGPFYPPSTLPLLHRLTSFQDGGVHNLTPYP